MKNKPIIGGIILLALAGGLFFARLGTTPLTNWDEGIYGKISLAMRHGGSWWTPMEDNQVFLEKPPLLFWLQQGSMSVFGETEFALRLWSALAGVLTTMLLAWWAWRWSKSLLTGVMTGLVYLTGHFVFFHGFRSGDMDGLLTLFFTATLIAYWLARRRPAWWFGVGAMMGLAVMIKSAVGLWPLLIMIVDLLLANKWRQLPGKYLGGGALLFLAIAGPWHIAMMINHWSAWWDQAVNFNLFNRVSASVTDSPQSWTWHIRVLALRWFPWFALIPLAGLRTILRWWRRDEDSETDRLMIIWAVVVFGLLEISATKFDWYLYPLYPVLALMIGRLIGEMISHRLHYWWLVAGGVSAALALYLVPGQFSPSGSLGHWLPTGWWSIEMSRLTRVVFAAVSAGGLMGLGWMLSRVARNKTATIIVVPVLVYFLFLAGGWQVTTIKNLPTSNFWTDLATMLHQDQVKTIGVMNTWGRLEPAGYFYLQRIDGLTIKTDDPTALVVLYQAKRGPVVAGRILLASSGGYQVVKTGE
jgi:4-amino-4-deoxy-L-arabinose transferase-like glycosyltransferase